jgi:hypothetical protein
MTVFIGDCENTGVASKNPDFPKPERPIFTRVRACGSFQGNALHIVIGLVTLTREA